MVKNPPAIAGDARDVGSIPGLGRYPGIGNGNPLSHGQRSLADNRPRGHKESDTTEHTGTDSFWALDPPLHRERKVSKLLPTNLSGVEFSEVLGVQGLCFPSQRKLHLKRAKNPFV